MKGPLQLVSSSGISSMEDVLDAGIDGIDRNFLSTFDCGNESSFEEFNQTPVRQFDDHPDFPIFDGSNPRIWIMLCETYFRFHPSMSDVQKIDIAIWNFEGRAFSWIIELPIFDVLAVSWKQFCELVCYRFEEYRAFEIKIDTGSAVNGENSKCGEEKDARNLGGDTCDDIFDVKPTAGDSYFRGIGGHPLLSEQTAKDMELTEKESFVKQFDIKGDIPEPFQTFWSELLVLGMTPPKDMFPRGWEVDRKELEFIRGTQISWDPGDSIVGGHSNLVKNGELALVNTSSTYFSSVQERKLGGGLDSLTLKSMYGEGAYRASQQPIYGTPAPNPFEVRDPFAVSNSVAIPQKIQHQINPGKVLDINLESISHADASAYVNKEPGSGKYSDGGVEQSSLTGETMPVVTPVFLDNAETIRVNVVVQHWNSHLYDWKAMDRDGFSWWTRRLIRAQNLFDELRIDQFGGFAGFWVVPPEAKIAIVGRWKVGPGKFLFDAIFGAFGQITIAEDLGIVIEDVVQLGKTFGAPGMAVLQVGFGSDAGKQFIVQEFTIRPTGASSFKEAMKMGVEVSHLLKAVIENTYGQDATNVGDKGGRDFIEALFQFFAAKSSLLLLPEALVTAKLATSFPENGGYVLWISSAFGPFWGFQEGFWKWFSGVMDNALYPVLFLDYFKHSFPIFDDTVARIPVLLGITMLLTYLNYRGLNIVGLSAVLLACFSLSPFIVMGILSIPRIRPRRWLVVDYKKVEWRGYFNSLFWNLNYWDNASTLAGEVENPSKTFPRALMGAVVVVICSYLVPLFAGTGAVETDASEWSDGYFAQIGMLIGEIQGKLDGALKVAAKVIGEVQALIIFPVIPYALLAIFYMFWLSVALHLFSSRSVQQNDCGANCCAYDLKVKRLSCNNCCGYSIHYTSHIAAAVIFHLFGGYWATQFSLACSSTMIAGSYAFGMVSDAFSSLAFTSLAVMVGAAGAIVVGFPVLGELAHALQENMMYAIAKISSGLSYACWNVAIETMIKLFSSLKEETMARSALALDQRRGLHVFLKLSWRPKLSRLMNWDIRLFSILEDEDHSKGGVMSWPKVVEDGYELTRN